MLDHLTPQLKKTIPPIPKEGLVYSRIINKNDKTRQGPPMGAPLMLASSCEIVDPYEPDPFKRRKKLVHAPTDAFVTNPLTNQVELKGKPEMVESDNRGNFFVREDEYLKHAFLYLHPDNRSNPYRPNTPPKFELTKSRKQEMVEETRLMEKQKIAYDLVKQMEMKDLRLVMKEEFDSKGRYDLLGKTPNEIRFDAQKFAQANPDIFIAASASDETRAKVLLSEAQIAGALSFDRGSRRWLDNNEKEIVGVAIGKNAEEAILAHLVKLGREGMEKLEATLFQTA